MITAHCLAALALSVACTAALADDRATLGETTFVLVSDRAACRLIDMRPAFDTVQRLPLAGLCSFHRGSDGALRTVQTDSGPIFLIETSVPQTGSTQDCDTQVLALRITPDGVTPAPQPARVASCLPFQWDDAMFVGAF